MTDRKRILNGSQKAQQIHVTQLIGLLEKFNGMTFVDVTSLGVRHGNGQFTALTDATGSTGQAGESMTSRVVYIGLDGAQVSFLEQSYAQLKQSVYDGLVLQTRLADFGEAANEAAWERVA